MEIVTEISWLITGLPFKSRATAWYLKACGCLLASKKTRQDKGKKKKVFFILRKTFSEIIFKVNIFIQYCD